MGLSLNSCTQTLPRLIRSDTWQRGIKVSRDRVHAWDKQPSPTPLSCWTPCSRYTCSHNAWKCRSKQAVWGISQIRDFTDHRYAILNKLISAANTKRGEPCNTLHAVSASYHNQIQLATWNCQLKACNVSKFASYWACIPTQLAYGSFAFALLTKRPTRWDNIHAWLVSATTYILVS